MTVSQRLWTAARALFVLTVILTVAAAGSSPVGAAPTTQRVRMAINAALSGTAFFLAAGKGYFQRFGVEPEFTYSIGDPAIVTTLNAGGIDLVQGAIRAASFELVNRGGRIRVVAASGSVPTNCTAVTLLAGSRFASAHPQTKVADLRGARIGMVSLREGSIADFLMAKWLKTGGLTVNDVQLFRIPPPAALPTLAAGTVDAIQTVEPFVTSILDRQAGIILARDTPFAGLPTTVVYIGPTLRAQPGLAARVLAGYMLGVRDSMAPDAKRNPENIAILSKALGLSEDLIRRSCWFPTPKDGRVNIKGIEEMRDWMVEDGYLPEPVPVNKLVDERYLRDAWRLLEAIGVKIH